MKKIVLTFGLISGAILSVMMAITVPFKEQIGFDRMEIVGYTSMVLSFLLIFLGVRSYRDNVAGGTVSFGRGLKVGALIALVASLCYVATWQVIYYNFTPNFFAEYSAYTIEKARADGASDEEIAKQTADMNKWGELYKNPLVNIGFTLIEVLPLGLVIALVSAGVLSRRRRSDVTADGVMRGSRVATS